MTSQIFKHKIPDESLFELMEKICSKNDKHYIFNLDAYKKGIFTEDIQKFIESCRPYYFSSKHKYLDKKISYNSITTILRQVCKFNKIAYTSKIIYDKSSYNIVYYIYFSNI